MRLTEQVHQYLVDAVQPGALVIDATAGNGHDTLKLAELVGPTGKVIAIDLQPEAIGATQKRLANQESLEQCQLIISDHGKALKDLEALYAEEVAAITFNLGYLPGSDKQIQTSPTSTLPALDAAWRLLRTGGLLLVTAYRGHPGGLEEAEQVANWIKQNCSDPISHEPEVKGDRIPPILWVARAT